MQIIIVSLHVCIYYVQLSLIYIYALVANLTISVTQSRFSFHSGYFALFFFTVNITVLESPSSWKILQGFDVLSWTKQEIRSY